MISIEALKKIISDQQEEVQNLSKNSKYIPRDLSVEEVGKVFSKGPGIVVIQGIRRSGKSTFAFNCFKERFVYINFDDERFFNLVAEDLNNILAASYELHGTDLEYFIFDELQNIKGWELFANRLQKTKKIIITGSNANLLSKELSTHLTGRYSLITLYPFSFREFLQLSGKDVPVNLDRLSTKKISEIKLLLKKYLLEGGFPDVQKYGPLFSQNIYSDIINKDILQRYKLRTPEAFKKFSHYAISNYAHEINLNKIGQYLGIKDPHTTAKYFSYLEETYLAFSLPRYFHKLKAQLVTNKKTYTIDSGLINTTAFTPSPSRGALFENVVFLELLRQRDYWKYHDELFFWQGTNSEVDFVTRSKNRFQSAIQVCLDFSRPETLEREKKAFLAIDKELKPGKYIIINESIEDQISIEKIKITLVPLWKWLLDPQKDSLRI